jgi:type VI secretion system secreted protein VgrG
VVNVDPVRGTVHVSTPLGDGVLLLQAMEAREELGRLFRLELELLSEKPSIDFDQVIGQPLTVSLAVQDGRTRYWHGIVSDFAQRSHEPRLSRYRATVRPWLWWLTRSADCRIFQEMTVPQIVERVFEGHGFSDYALRLSGNYPTLPYCAQYRETDFDFVSRLLEQEGICYYFVHEAGRHTLVLADGAASHDRARGYEKVPYTTDDRSAESRRDHIRNWLLRRSAQPVRYALRDFDFERPGDRLDVGSAIARQHARASHEIYDYPGEYRDADDGQRYATVRIQELQSGYERVEGVGNVRGLTVGSRFDLTGFPRDDQNRQYLIVSSTSRLNAGAHEAGRIRAPSFEVGFEAIPAAEPFRPARSTPRPVIRGPQTAIVAGPPGEEIWTDEHGRVKVRFHWDRQGGADEHSSCWLRVAQAWAGRQWGTQMLPRVGDEVIVEFLEGDPDRPIVTGRVYNGENTPPYALPREKTQSGVRTRSSPGGGGFNELRFEDKAGSEALIVHAARDCRIEVENDRSTSVARDEAHSVGRDRSVEVGGDHAQTVGAACRLTVGTDLSETVGSDRSVNVGGDYAEEAGKARTLAAKSVRIEAADEITLVTGKAQISLKKNGDVAIKGKKIEIKASGRVVIKGQKVVEN